MRFRRLVAVFAVAAGVLLVPAGSAVASTGPVLTSPEQAGYAVTGARFRNAETWVTLPNAAQFSGEVGQVSMSVQLMTSGSLIDLTVTACTDASCRAGGKPLTHRYHLQLAVYHRDTGALICSTSAPGSLRCPGVPASWNRARVAPGRFTELALSYPPPYEVVFASVNNQEYDYPVAAHSVFGQARIGVEFGATPWASASFTGPAQGHGGGQVRPAHPAALCRGDRDHQRVGGRDRVLVGGPPGADDRRAVREAAGSRAGRAVGRRLRVHRLPRTLTGPLEARSPAVGR